MKVMNEPAEAPVYLEKPLADFPIRAFVPICVFFFVAGIASVMLGPLLPNLIALWHLQDAQAGTLFAACFAGQFCGALIGPRLLRASLIYGALLSAISCFALTLTGFNAAHIALFVMGLGIGAGLTAGNIIAGTSIASARTRLLVLVGLSWSVGAILSPVIAKLFAVSQTMHFFSVTAALLAVSGLLSTTLPRTIDAPSIPLTPRRQRLPLDPISYISFGLAIMLYVGVENSLGGWLPSYAVRSGVPHAAATVAFYFWSAEIAGRLLIPLLPRLARETPLYRVCVSALICIGVALSANIHPSTPWIIAMVLLSGFLLAPVFPLILSFLLARTGRRANLGPLFASASLGGAVFPWLTGFFSTRQHSLRLALIVPLAGAIGLLLLSIIVKQQSPDAPRTDP